MKASTHTEVYRRFQGTPARWPLRPLVLAQSGVRQGFKRKLPALLLYAPVAIGTIIGCFKVYLRYQLLAPSPGGEGKEGVGIGPALLVEVLGDTVDNILEFLNATSLFGLLAITWYGAGMIAEDRRLGANLLYFSRPLTRLGYLGGKLLAACIFGGLATLIPCLTICFIAAFASPQWAFLREEWDTIVSTIVLCAGWTVLLALIVLAVSSMVRRKTHALVGVVGFFMLTGGIGGYLSDLAKNPRFMLLSPVANMQRLGEWMLLERADPNIGPQATLLAIAAVVVLACTILAARVRHMEVVA